MKTLLFCLCILAVGTPVCSQTQIDTLLVKVGFELEEDLNRLSSEVFLFYFDSELFASSFIIEDSTNTELTTLNETVRESFASLFVNAILQELENGSYYNFVNHDYDAFGNHFLLFRLYSEAGLNYHEFLLTEKESGELIISDVYLYLSGEYLSQTMSRYYLSGATMLLNEELYEKEEFKVLEYADDVQEIQQLIQLGQKDRAMEIYREFPEEIRKEKTVQLFALQLIDIETQEEEYAKILQEYLDLYPNDPSLYLISIDHYVIKGDYDKAQAMIDTLGMLTNDDFLYFLLGNMEYLKGNKDKTEEYYQYVLEQFPGFLYVYDVLLAFYIEEKRYEEGVEMLKKMDVNFDMDKLILDEILSEDYPDFAKSLEYLNWKKE